MVDMSADDNVTFYTTDDYATTFAPPVDAVPGSSSLFFTETVWYNIINFCLNSAAIFLNGLIVYIVVRFKEMRSSVTLCFANFAITDIFLVLSQMIGPVKLLLGFDIKKYIDCRYTFYFHQVTILATAMTMTFLSFDRYRVISMPLSLMNRKKRNIMLAFIFIWITAFSVNAYIPSLLVVYGNHCVSVFKNVDPVTGARILNTSRVIMNYLLPVIVSSAFYIRIFFVLRDTMSSSDGNVSSATIGKGDQSLRARRLRGIRTAALVLLWYALCYLPGNVLNMWRTWDPTFPRDQYYVLHLAAGFPSKLNTLTNPFVYSLSAASFQRKVKKILLCGFQLPTGLSTSEAEKRCIAKSDVNPSSDMNTVRSSSL